MAKSIDDLINNLTTLEAAIKAELPKITLEYAQNAYALTIQHIEKEGVKNGAAYSEDPVYVTQNVFNNKGAFKPVGKFGKDANISSGFSDVATKKKKTKVIKADGSDRTSMYLPGGYKQLRQIQGLPVNVVNLEYSRRMTQNIKPLKALAENEFKFVAIIGATNDEEKKKMAGNFKRYGDFLKITAEVAKVINVIPPARIKEIFKKILG